MITVFVVVFIVRSRRFALLILFSWCVVKVTSLITLYCVLSGYPPVPPRGYPQIGSRGPSWTGPVAGIGTGPGTELGSTPRPPPHPMDRQTENITFPSYYTYAGGNNIQFRLQTAFTCKQTAHTDGAYSGREDNVWTIFRLQNAAI